MIKVMVIVQFLAKTVLRIEKKQPSLGGGRVKKNNVVPEIDN